VAAVLRLGSVFNKLH